MGYVHVHVPEASAIGNATGEASSKSKHDCDGREESELSHNKRRKPNHHTIQPPRPRTSVGYAYVYVHIPEPTENATREPTAKTKATTRRNTRLRHGRERAMAEAHTDADAVGQLYGAQVQILAQSQAARPVTDTRRCLRQRQKWTTADAIKTRSLPPNIF